MNSDVMTDVILVMGIRMQNHKCNEVSCPPVAPRLDHPLRAIVGLSLVLKFDLDPIYYRAAWNADAV